MLTSFTENFTIIIYGIIVKYKVHVYAINITLVLPCCDLGLTQSFQI